MGNRRGAGCPFEIEVIGAARTGRWPDRLDADLRAHLETCSSCREVGALSGMFAAEWDAALAEADPPSAELTWWRAQRRARLEAARAAEAPVRTALMIAAAGALALAVVLGWWVSGSLGPMLADLAAHAPAPADALRSDAAPLVRGAALLAVLAAVVFVPVAFYLAVADD